MRILLSVSAASKVLGVSPALRGAGTCFALTDAQAQSAAADAACHIVCFICAEGSDSAVLDFNDTVGAVLLVGESRLTLRRLQLERLAPVTDGYTSGSYVSMTSMLWPSINAAPGSKVRRQRCASRLSAPASAGHECSQCHGTRRFDGILVSVACSSSRCWHTPTYAALLPFHSDLCSSVYSLSRPCLNTTALGCIRKVVLCLTVAVVAAVPPGQHGHLFFEPPPRRLQVRHR